MNLPGEITNYVWWASGPAAGPLVLTLAEIAILAAMAGLTLAWLGWKRLLRANRDAVGRRFGMYVMQATVERLHDGSPIFNSDFLAKRQLKQIIMGQLLRTGGDGRSGLADLYRRLGFLGMDLDALSSRSWRRRAEACTALSLAGDDDVAEKLAGLLRDPSETVRIAAARALTWRGGGKYVVPLLEAMVASPGWCGRMMADSIAALGGAAFEAVKDALEKQTSAQTRPGLIDLLGRMKDPRCIPLLIRLLRDGDDEVRIRAARGLGSVRDRRAANALEDALGDASWEVRAQAAKSLGRVGDEICVSRLAACLDDRQWWVRYNGAHALAALGGAGTDELNRIASEGRGFARDIARQVLGMERGSEGA